MGLDQFISATIHVPAQKVGDVIEDNPILKKLVDDQFSLASVNFKLGQFRKFNALHGYIESRIGGVENLQDIHINEIIDELYEDCKIILATKDSKDGNADAIKRMPPTEGFFFGSTEVDSWYYSDVKELYDLLADLIKLSEIEGISFYYTAWW